MNSTFLSRFNSKTIGAIVIIFAFGIFLGKMIPSFSGINQRGASLDSEMADRSIMFQNLIKSDIGSQKEYELCKESILIDGKCLSPQLLGVTMVDSMASVVAKYIDNPQAFIAERITQNTTQSSMSQTGGSVDLPIGYACTNYSSGNATFVTFSCLCVGNAAGTFGQYYSLNGTCPL